ncbi:MAG: hypothetical protein ACI4EQ_03125 [Lachnospiraceae bacterium]
MIEIIIMILNLLAVEGTVPETGGIAVPMHNVVYVAEFTEEWQQAYYEVLTEVRLDNENYEGNEEYTDFSESYYLYDIDKDDIPELLVEYGFGESDYHADIYTYADGEVRNLGTIATGHTTLYTWPEENAMMYYFAHMGGAYVDKISIIDGELVSEQIHEEYILTGEWYTDEQELAPGALYLYRNSTDSDLPLVVYNSIMNDKELPFSTGGSVSNKETREILLAVLEEDGMVYGVSGDGFGGDTGYVNFSEYCEPGGAAQFADSVLSVEAYTWVDLNGDGQDECIVDLTEPETDTWRQEIRTVLSLQDEVVYAYCFNYQNDYLLYGDGVFYDDEYGRAHKICFNKDECFQYTAELNEAAKEADWETSFFP